VDLYPAIDLRGGRCVRLRQGDFARETAYDADPVATAEAYAAAGARWVHVVDLDAARTGDPANRAVVAAIAAAVAPGASVQAGGGVRDRASAQALVAAGVARVVVGTAAVEQPGLVVELAAEVPVAVGLDSRGGVLAVRGWVEDAPATVADLVALLADAGVAAFVVTDITRDGMLAGPDLAGLAAVLAASPVEVVASGGVGTLEDLRRLADLEVGGRRLAGSVVGRALWDGRFSIEEAVAACAPSG